MSVHALPRAELTGLVRAARDAAAAADALPLDAVPDDELARSLRDVVQLESRLRALRLKVLRETEVRRLAEETAATDTAAWAAGLTGTTRGVMSGGLWLARMLEENYSLTRRAFARGAISEQQVRIIVDAAELMPAALSDADREAAEAWLVELAVDGLNPRRLRQRARRMVERASRELADQHEKTLLERDEARAEAETWMTLGDRGDGTYAGKFVIPEAQGRMLSSFLERLTSPRRLTRNKAGESIVDDTAGSGFGGLNWSEALGAGLVELIEHLPTDGWSGVNTTMVVTVELRHLLDGLGSAHLDTGVALSAGQARRLACEAGIVPAVLGGPSEVLDLGRTMRLANVAIQRAIRLLHDSCAAEGCERPVAWCELHHRRPWSEGGETSLANTVPLCGHHHRRAHDRGYDLTDLDSGEVRFRRRRCPAAPNPPDSGGQAAAIRHIAPRHDARAGSGPPGHPTLPRQRRLAPPTPPAPPPTASPRAPARPSRT